jgi:hypothetical protein
MDWRIYRLKLNIWRDHDCIKAENTAPNFKGPCHFGSQIPTYERNFEYIQSHMPWFNVEFFFFHNTAVTSDKRDSQTLYYVISFVGSFFK